MIAAFLFFLSSLALSNAQVLVSLDFGWRTTPYQQAPCGGGSDIIMKDVCLDISPPTKDYHSWIVPASSTSDCSAAACAARTSTWSYNGTLCVIGDASMLGINTSLCKAFTTGIRDPTAWPPTLPPEASLAYDDASWEVVDLPHDASANTPHVFPAAGGQGFRHPVAAFYRKHFRLNASWEGKAISLHFPGAATSSAWWLNGVPLSPRTNAGYLPTHALNIDPATYHLVFDGTTVNVLAAWTDNMGRSGWWEEAAGLTRGGTLLRVGAPEGGFSPSGIAAPAFISGPVHTRATPALGIYAESASMSPSADIIMAMGGMEVLVVWELLDTVSGEVIPGAAANTTLRIPAGGGAFTLAPPPASLTIAPVAELWSVPRPYLYTLRSTLSVVGGGILDTRTDTLGIRDVTWSGDTGMSLNGQGVKMRGFCEHATWGGVGGAVPVRADLLRLQHLRGVGGNALRTSHNPPAPQLLDLADRLGVVMLDENRVLTTISNVNGGAECGEGGCRDIPYYVGDIAETAAALARRDRLHPSISFLSLCNELGCGPGTLLAGDLVQRVKEAIVSVDASRAITGNLGWQGVNATRPGTPFDDVMDVMGMSHQSPAVLTAFHAASPFKPVAMTECCSCESMRAADNDIPANSSTVYYSNEQSRCLTEQTQVSNLPLFCAGTFVWTLSDYGGEADVFPHVSSSFGSFDFSGEAKAAAFWFRAWWLAAVGDGDFGRPPLPSTSTMVHIVEAWQPSPNGTRTIHVYTNAPNVHLTLPDGSTLASPTLTEFGVPAVFYQVPYKPGKLTATALAADGATVLGTHTIASFGAPAAILLTLESPALHTGTGSAVYWDGQDVAMVRAVVVDGAGNPCNGGGSEGEGQGPAITFTVTSGPGRVIGTHNGDPALQLPSNSTTLPAYGGVARAIARVTSVVAGSVEERGLLALVNKDAGVGGSSWVFLGIAPPPGGGNSFTITATSPGLTPGVLVVPLSFDPQDAPLAVAAANVGRAEVGAI